MIYIDDVPVDFRKKGVKTKMESLIDSAWKSLDSIYSLEKGMPIKLVFDKRRGVVKNHYSEDMKLIRKNVVSDKRVHISRISTITMNDDNEIKVIRLADSRKIKMVNGEPQYEYSPKGHINFSSTLSLTSKNKELILFLYLFAPFIQTKPAQMGYTIETSVPPMLMFENKYDTALEKMSKIKQDAKILEIIESLDNQRLEAFARRVGISKPEKKNRTILENEVFSISSKNEEGYVKLKEFNLNFNKEYFDCVDVCNLAIEKEIITQERDSGSMAKFLVNGEVIFSTKIKSVRENIEELYWHVSKHEEHYHIIKNLMK
jgi:hypothetical protein